jgi:hypothetical protein
MDCEMNKVLLLVGWLVGMKTDGGVQLCSVLCYVQCFFGVDFGAHG